MHISKYLHIALVLVVVSVVPTMLHAQIKTTSVPRIYTEVSPSQITVGTHVILRILIDSEKPINALETTFTYDDTLVQAVSFNDSSSIIQLWQDKDLKSTMGKVLLSGGIPRAFAGNKGEIGRLTFKALKPGSVAIGFSVADIYYADGLGTRAAAQKGTSRFDIQTETRTLTKPTPQVEQIPMGPKDTIPPVFGLTDTLRNPSKGNYLSIFEVKDTGSGIAQVEMRTNKLISWSNWKEVANPAEVSSGTFRYQLRATDNEGNISTETLYIRSKLIMILGIVILSFAFLVGALYFIIKR
jgi:hypothetical protein